MIWHPELIHSAFQNDLNVLWMYNQDYFLLLGSFQQRDPLRVERILQFGPLEQILNQEKRIFDQH